MMKKVDEKTETREGGKSATRADSRRQRPKFEPPKVITHSGDEILEELGPAHACSPYSGAVVGC
jgi:hypothetical protein